VFGNDIDDQGESVDRVGRVIDPTNFVRGADGKVTDDDQRDAEYTRHVGRRLAEAYPRLTVFHTTHLVARALFDCIAHNCGTRDIYRLLRAPLGRMEIPLTEAKNQLTVLRQAIRENPNAGAEHPLIEQQSDQQILDDALRGLGTYHTTPVVRQNGSVLVVGDLRLLYYYQNRTAHLKLPPQQALGVG
jgi:glycerol-3-phosphate O-acyltransferase